MKIGDAVDKTWVMFGKDDCFWLLPFQRARYLSYLILVTSNCFPHSSTCWPSHHHSFKPTPPS